MYNTFFPHQFQAVYRARITPSDSINSKSKLSMFIPLQSCRIGRCFTYSSYDVHTICSVRGNAGPLSEEDEDFLVDSLPCAIKIGTRSSVSVCKTNASDRARDANINRFFVWKEDDQSTIERDFSPTIFWNVVQIWTKIIKKQLIFVAQLFPLSSLAELSLWLKGLWLKILIFQYWH